MNCDERFAKGVEELARLLYQMNGQGLPQAIGSLDQLARLARTYQALDNGNTGGGDSCAHLCDSTLAR